MQGPCRIQEEGRARGAAVCRPAAAGPAGRGGSHHPCAASQAGAPACGDKLQPHGGRHLSAGQVAVLHADCCARLLYLGRCLVCPSCKAMTAFSSCSGVCGCRQASWRPQSMHASHSLFDVIAAELACCACILGAVLPLVPASTATQQTRCNQPVPERQTLAAKITQRKCVVHFLSAAASHLCVQCWCVHDPLTVVMHGVS